MEEAVEGNRPNRLSRLVGSLRLVGMIPKILRIRTTLRILSILMKIQRIQMTRKIPKTQMTQDSLLPNPPTDQNRRFSKSQTIRSPRDR